MRLIDEMRAELAKIQDRATGYRMCGEHSLSTDLTFAASKLIVAINALEIAYAGEREAKEGIEA